MPVGEDTGGNVNIDLTPLVKAVESLSKTDKQLIRDCAIALFTYTNFEQTEKSTFQLAKECIDRAVIMINELKSQGII